MQLSSAHPADSCGAYPDRVEAFQASSELKETSIASHSQPCGEREADRVHQRAYAKCLLAPASRSRLFKIIVDDQGAR